MSELQDAIDLLTDDKYRPPEITDARFLVLKTARRVANLDIEKAVKAYMAYTATDERTARFGVDRIVAALGITTENT